MKKLMFLLVGLSCCALVFAWTPPEQRDPRTYYVDVNVDGGSNNGLTWEDAFTTIKEGIEAATVDGDIVLVAQGTYNSGTTVTPGGSLLNRVVITRAIGVYAVDGAALTIIEGAEATGGGNGADAVRAVYQTAGTLKGFTITKGHTNTSGNIDLDRSGGALYQTGSGGTTTLCVISGNSADAYGGAAYLDGDGIITNCTLTDNTCPLDGGAVYLDGGGQLKTCLLTHNTCSQAGGAAYLDGGGELITCTVSANTATGNGGGAYLNDGGTLINSILWGNSGSSGDDIYDYDSGTNTTIGNCCASDGLTDEVNGCTTSDPLFLDAASDNYRIYINSPCFNSGQFSGSPGTYDLDGEDRVQFNTIDMGAYESGGVDITFTDGSSYSSSLSLGQDNQAFGRFQLTGATAGASLTEVYIKLNGSRTGINGFKLWSSADDSFDSGSDTQLGFEPDDPGSGNSVSYSSFTSPIAASGTYYFITANVASDATGSIQGILMGNYSLTINIGNLSGTISNAVLSNVGVEVPTPICLASFVAEANKGNVELAWTTATETAPAMSRMYS